MISEKTDWIWTFDIGALENCEFWRKKNITIYYFFNKPSC